MTVGERIQTYRKSLGLSQEKPGQKLLGIDQRKIKEPIENNEAFAAKKKKKCILSYVCTLLIIVFSFFTIFPFFAVSASEIEQVSIYKGETTIETPWTLGPTVYTTMAGGDFDPFEITPGGYFSIRYTGTEGAVYLAFAEWSNNVWASIMPDYTEINHDGSYTSVFSFESCASAYNATDLSGIHAICAGTADSKTATTITEINWFGTPVFVTPKEATVLFKGSATAVTKDQNLTFFYTAHAGGKWDGSVINKNSCFYIEYTGAKDGVYLVLSSASGATGWAAVYPNETGVGNNGVRYSVFDYDQFAEKFGTNFARLDQVQVLSSKNEQVTLKRVLYFPGEGKPVDDSDGTWDRSKNGIAFIGDSIVQNPMVDTQHLNNIDWNGILNRTDCVNYGIGGQTTKECLSRIEELTKKNYEKLVILCGINDIGKNHSDQEIISNYLGIIEKMQKSNPNIEIFIISVLPTTSAFYPDTQHKIVSLNTALKTMAQNTDGVTFIDCYSSFLDETGYCKTELTFDGLHPNLNGYALIANALSPYLEQNTQDQPDEKSHMQPHSPAPKPILFVIVSVILLISVALFFLLRFYNRKM